MSKQDGGPAFPSSGVICDDGILYEGMSLRDYFAAKALQGWFSTWDNKHKVHEASLALFCYDVADAMLAVRYEEEE